MSRKFKNSKVTKVISGLTGLMTAVVMVGGALVVPASAATAAELQSQIDALLSQVQTLQGQAEGGGSASSGYTFSKNLLLGSTGADVKALQELLNQDSDTQVSVTGAGSPGAETSYFGPATKRAVIKFQEKYADEILAPIGLAHGTGTVGPATRAKLNEWSGTVSSTDTTTSTFPAGCTSASGFSPTTGQSCASGTTTTTTTTLPAGCTSASGFSPTTGQSCAGGTTTTTTTTGAGTLTVSSATQPMNSLAPKGTSRVPFTTFTLTAGASDVSVTGVTVQRAGLAQDAAFAGVVLLSSDGTQLGIAKTLNSDHTATVGDPFTVKAGTSATYTIAGNMAADETSYAGQVAQLNVMGIQTAATVSGTFPILGAQQTINNTLSVGTATFAASSFDPNTAQSKQIGETAYKFSGLRVTAGSAERVILKSVRWYQSGSAASGDLANVITKVDGDSTLYPTTVSADGKYYTTIFGTSGLLIDKGLSKDLYVTGDLVGAGSSGRTVEFDVYKNTDIYMTGETYGYGIIGTATANCNAVASTATTASEFINSSTSCASSGTIGTPFYSASVLTISAGSVTSLQKATSVPSQNIAVNVPNQILGGYIVDLKGEPVAVQSHVFTIASSTAVAGNGVLTSVTLVDENGAVVAGPVDGVSATGNTPTQTVTFTDTVTYKIGAHTYTLKGKVPSTASTGNTYQVSSFTLSSATGQTTGNTITFPAGTALNTMTVKSGALAVSVSSQPVAQSIVSGGTNVLLANYQLDASQSGEDVRFSSLTGTLTSTGTEFATTSLTNCQIYNDAGVSITTGSNVVNPTATTIAWTFDNSYTVTKGTTKTLSAKCNLSTAAVAGNIVSLGLAASALGTATGQTSGNTVGTTYSASVGPAMTIAAGSFAVSQDSSAPSYTVVGSSANVPATGIVANVLRFRATNEGVNLTKLGIQLTNATVASSSSSDLLQYTVWDGSTLLGTQTITGSASFATTTLTLMNPAGVPLPKDIDKLITIKADLAQVGTNQSGTQGHLVKLDFLNAEGTGVQSGSTLEATGSTAVGGLRVFKSYPTVAIDTLSVTGGGVASDGNLIRFKVTASPSGDVALTSFNVKFATTSATISNLNAFAYTDAAYSQGVSGVSNGGQLKSTNVSLAAWADSTTVIGMTVTDSAGVASSVSIPAGQTRYFQVHGTVTPSTTTYSVGTTLLGDNAYPGLATTFMANAAVVEAGVSGTNNDFVWSPNATTTSIRTANDWTNGYQIPGLPTSGLSQNRTN
ncbi:MAG: peptidoglycan-binding domain-containing protein [Candidatus Paceibacterota bacterium]|jgi:hypothetical protein